MHSCIVVAIPHDPGNHFPHMGTSFYGVRAACAAVHAMAPYNTKWTLIRVRAALWRTA